MDSLIDCHNVGLKLGLEETFVLPVIGFVRVKQLKMFPNSFLGSQLIFINVFFFYKKVLYWNNQTKNLFIQDTCQTQFNFGYLSKGESSVLCIGWDTKLTRNPFKIYVSPISPLVHKSTKKKPNSLSNTILDPIHTQKIYILFFLIFSRALWPPMIQQFLIMVNTKETPCGAVYYQTFSMFYKIDKLNHCNKIAIFKITQLNHSVANLILKRVPQQVGKWLKSTTISVHQPT